MDPISLFAAIVIAGMNHEIAENRTQIENLTSEVIVLDVRTNQLSDELEVLDATVDRLAAKHSSLHANNKLEHEKMQNKINSLIDELSTLEQKLNASN